MKLYIAASSAEIERARIWTARAKLAGIDVVSTWIATIDKVGHANPTEATREQRADWSYTDMAEVASADVLWFLVPPVSKPTRGAWIEVGCAHAHERHLVFSGETSQSIFCAMGEEWASDEDALESILCRGREGRA